MKTAVLCYHCDERDAEGVRYPVVDGFKTVGYQCEPCAEGAWESFEEWRMG